jgi:hypothetical protein
MLPNARAQSAARVATSASGGGERQDDRLDERRQRSDAAVDVLGFEWEGCHGLRASSATDDLRHAAYSTDLRGVDRARDADLGAPRILRVKNHGGRLGGAHRRMGHGEVTDTDALVIGNDEIDRNKR